MIYSHMYHIRAPLPKQGPKTLASAAVSEGESSHVLALVYIDRIARVSDPSLPAKRAEKRA